MAKASTAAKGGDDLADFIRDMIGDNDEKQEVRFWLDTGFPPLNKAISNRYDGGMPCGRMVEMYGPPSAGKTAIATNVMIAAQKAGGIAVFLDHERSFDAGLAESLGLDTSPGRWIYKKPETFEASMDLVKRLARGIRERKLIPDDAPMVVVFDSLASMVPHSTLYDSKGGEKDAEDRNMNDNTALARATSAHFPALATIAEKYEVLCLFLNQQRTKMGVMYGDPTSTPGGNAPEFYASVRIKLSRAMLKDKASQEVLGQRITAECIKNKVSRPYQKAAWNFLFKADGTGHFDVAGSLLEYLKEQGKLTVSGAFIEWVDGKKYYLGPLAKKIIDDGEMNVLMGMLEDKR